MRVAVISDIHSNLAALEAVLADAGAVDETWCLGDVVGYGPQPNECIDLLHTREPDLVCVAGNHDWAALGLLDTADFNPDAERAALWTREQVTAASRTYLESLPQAVPQGDFTLVHGSPRDPIREYLISADVARSNFALLGTRYCFVGHSHHPFVFVEAGDARAMPELQAPLAGGAAALGERRLFINPGSVGQPRDGNPKASFLILDTDKHTIEHRRVEYAVKVTQRLMQEARLPERLSRRLGYGV